MEIVVVSGGTATNALVEVFGRLASRTSYVIPVSDNGGSTSEILRVLGGPAIGDLRSRVTRLIPEESAAMRKVLAYRLSDIRDEAQAEWARIVDGSHSLWTGVSPECREMIRPFFIQVHAELLKRGRPGREFRFERASVGNLFLSGARMFCGSLDSAIELLARITRVPASVAVLPAVNTNFTHHIAAVLKDGTLVTGQNEISHPSVIPSHAATDDDNDFGDPSEDANLPFTHPALARSQVFFSKDGTGPEAASQLPAPIDRVHYINPFGEEIKPRASPRVLAALDRCGAVIFSVGSLYTSIIPVVLLQGFGDRLRSRPDAKKIMLLNGTEDRETRTMTAVEHVRAVVRAGVYSQGSIDATGAASGPSGGASGYDTPQDSDLSCEQDIDSVPWTDYVTDLVHLHEPTGIPVDTAALHARGIRTHYVPHVPGETGLYDVASLEHGLLSILHSR